MASRISRDCETSVESGRVLLDELKAADDDTRGYATSRRKPAGLLRAAYPLLAVLTVAVLAASSAAASNVAAKPVLKLLFTSTRSGVEQIYVMSPDGSGARRLTRNRVAESHPAVSPDGRSIAFSRGGDAPGIYVMNRSGRNQRRLTSKGLAPSWSPDGARIVFFRFGDVEGGLFTMPLDGSGVARVPNSSTEDFDPDWSPDGDWFAFARAQGVDYDASIMVMRVTGEQQRAVGQPPCYYSEMSPEFSPNGRELVFSCWVRRPNGQVSFALYRLNLSGSKVQRLSPLRLYAEEPAWSPSGKTIAFAAGRTYDGDRDIYLVGNDGRNLRRLTRGRAYDSDPAWLPAPR